MENILILCDDYYPSSRATIAITQRFAEGLVEKGYNVKVLTIREKIATKPNYPKNLNGVEIIDYSDIEHLLEEKTCLKLNKMDKNLAHLLRFIQREKKLLIKGNLSKNFIFSKWNLLIDKIRGAHRRIYNKRVSNRYIFHRKKFLDILLSSDNYDRLISVALPFSIHRIAGLAKMTYRKINWTAIGFDPYAYDETNERRVKIRRIKEEKKVYSNADTIMLLSQFGKDYLNSPFASKIQYFDLPNIRPISTKCLDCSINITAQKISCVFVGNLFLKQRHPKYLFELLERLDNNVVLYVVGGLIDIDKSYIDYWVNKLSGKLVYCGRVSQDEALFVINKADILVNIGNVTTNQCPSKLIDYISTGKPIINISKIKECTSEKCLEKYPRKLLLSENEEVTDEVLKNINEFLCEVKSKERINYEEIEELYNDYTMKSMIDKFVM